MYKCIGKKRKCDLAYNLGILLNIALIILYFWYRQYFLKIIMNSLFSFKSLYFSAYCIDYNLQ